jgi:hypothetical protein
MQVEKMSRGKAEIAVDETVARNPLILRKWHCKPCTIGACAMEYAQQRTSNVRSDFFKG